MRQIIAFDTPSIPGDDCLVFTCQRAVVACPASYAEKCPDWTVLSCGRPPNETYPYWAQKCVPFAYPAPNREVKLSCRQERDATTGAFQCYLSQVRVLVLERAAVI